MIFPTGLQSLTEDLVVGPSTIENGAFIDAMNHTISREDIGAAGWYTLLICEPGPLQTTLYDLIVNGLQPSPQAAAQWSGIYINGTPGVPVNVAIHGGRVFGNPQAGVWIIDDATVFLDQVEGGVDGIVAMENGVGDIVVVGVRSFVTAFECSVDFINEEQNPEVGATLDDASRSEYIRCVVRKAINVVRRVPGDEVRLIQTPPTTSPTGNVALQQLDSGLIRAEGSRWENSDFTLHTPNTTELVDVHLPSFAVVVMSWRYSFHETGSHMLLDNCTFHGTTELITHGHGTIDVKGGNLATIRAKFGYAFYDAHLEATYALTGGDDIALFALDAETHELSFIDEPDFLDPQDADENNVYEVEYTATDPVGRPYVKQVLVTVTASGHNAGVLTAPASILTPSAAYPLKVGIIDPQGARTEYEITQASSAGVVWPLPS